MSIKNQKGYLQCQFQSFYLETVGALFVSELINAVNKVHMVKWGRKQTRLKSWTGLENRISQIKDLTT